MQSPGQGGSDHSSSTGKSEGISTGSDPTADTKAGFLHSYFLFFPNSARNELFVDKTPEAVGVTQSKERLFALPAQRKAQFADKRHPRVHK